MFSKLGRPTFIKTSILAVAFSTLMTFQASAGGSFDPLPEEKKLCSLSANVGITTDYVFRGFSQTKEEAAVQGGFDAECGIFYAGIWGSNVDLTDDNSIELDYYAGIKPTFEGFSFDFGVIYYDYPGDEDLDLWELKAGVSKEVAKGLTLGATGFFNIEEDNEYIVAEGSAEYALPKISIFSPSISGLVGFFEFDDSTIEDYVYWHAGLSLGFYEKFTLDLRYHDTDIDDVDEADSRFVATLSSSW